MSQLTLADRHWLDEAVRRADPLRGTTAENPIVGAIIVDPGQGIPNSPSALPASRTERYAEAFLAAGLVDRFELLSARPSSARWHSRHHQWHHHPAPRRHRLVETRHQSLGADTLTTFEPLRDKP